MISPEKRKRQRWLLATMAFAIVACIFVLTIDNTQSRSPSKELRKFEQISTLDNWSGNGYDVGSNDVHQRVMVITQHGKKSKPESNNVKMYGFTSKTKSSTWKSIGSLLDRSSIVDEHLANLRGVLAVGPTLYVVSAYTDHSKILATDKCKSKQSKGAAISQYYTISSSGLNHPYDLAMHNSALYVTNQNLNSVVRLPLSFTKAQEDIPVNVQHVVKVRQPRGIAFSKNGMMFVASIYDGLQCFQENMKGERLLVDTIKIRHPVGVSYDPRTDLLYVGNRVTRGNTASIYVINASTRKIVGTLQPQNGKKDFQHIAGVAVGNRKLFVIAQKARKVHAFNLIDGAYAGVVLPSLPPRPEQIELYYC